jgi:hypothetical protein
MRLALSCVLLRVVDVLGVSAFGPASAAGSAVVGSYTIVDLGQGGWGGGPLYANGTVGGRAHFSFLAMARTSATSRL